MHNSNVTTCKCERVCLVVSVENPKVDIVASAEEIKVLVLRKKKMSTNLAMTNFAGLFKSGMTPWPEPVTNWPEIDPLRSVL